jgi:hypothetical protein
MSQLSLSVVLGICFFVVMLCFYMLRKNHATYCFMVTLVRFASQEAKARTDKEDEDWRACYQCLPSYLEVLFSLRPLSAFEEEFLERLKQTKAHIA